ncbi:baseplate protein [Pantoea phage Kyle]|uniref:Baseplate protein n=1 Tax=Pantoea phage Kyle TaxID=2589665 RepID=A0A514A8L7_9CAUD|nr:baseplate protein [Pantoea phage Kyle]QDH49607.1 baseplate protein [Pantoea phage Kyle]
MKKRLLKVTFTMPDGKEQVLDQEIMLRCRIKKAALSIQNKATIEAGSLTGNLREFLLSNFTAFNKRLREQGAIDAFYVDVKIEAGYRENGSDNLYLVFKGQTVLAEISSPPPNLAVRITCYTQQIDRTKFRTRPAPSPSTFEAFCRYASEQMGLSAPPIIDTSINQMEVINPGRTAFVVAALLPEIQNYARNTIAAYIDDDQLIVRDKNRILDPQNVKLLTEFVEPPMWTEWGADFSTMYTPEVRLAQGVKFRSVLNPSLNDTTFVVLQIEYDLESRGDNFRMTGAVSPAAVSS